MCTDMQVALRSLCFMAVIGFSQQGNSYPKLTVSRFYAHVDPVTQPQFSFLCILQDVSQNAVPLTGCEYREYYSQNTWELNEGLASRNKTYTKGRVTMQGGYHGRGLRRGECGMTLKGYQDEEKFILGCRVRTAVGEPWQYAAMMIYVSSYWIPFRYYIKPSVTLALAGSEVTIIGKAKDYSLERCMFTVPPSHEFVVPDFDSDISSTDPGEASYYGRGLDSKDCGATFHDVQPEMSGFVTGYVTAAGTDRAAYDFAELIVATAPEAAPLLTVSSPTVLRPGDTLRATCIIRNSRPVANVTWYLDDRVVRSDQKYDGPLDQTWSWNHDLKSIEQRLLLPVNSSHNGKVLKCQAGHVALTSGYQDSTTYVVHVRDT